jgi:hypothetical protein
MYLYAPGVEAHPQYAVAGVYHLVLVCTAQLPAHVQAMREPAPQPVQATATPTWQSQGRVRTLDLGRTTNP